MQDIDIEAPIFEAFSISPISDVSNHDFSFQNQVGSNAHVRKGNSCNFYLLVIIFNKFFDNQYPLFSDAVSEEIGETLNMLPSIVEGFLHANDNVRVNAG